MWQNEVSTRVPSRNHAFTDFKLNKLDRKAPQHAISVLRYFECSEMTTPARIIPSYPHSAGSTKLAYSHDGRFLITVGADQLIRKFTVNEDSKEPETFEQHAEPVTSVAASRNAFASASEDCTVNLFNLTKSDQNIKLLTRCTLPVREVVFSSDGEWLGVASEYRSLK